VGITKIVAPVQLLKVAQSEAEGDIQNEQSLFLSDSGRGTGGEKPSGNNQPSLVRY